MAKKLLIIISCIVLVLSALLVGCKGQLAQYNPFSIPEQEDIEIQHTAKIYPSQVGNALKDESVSVPVIETFMAQYNAAATESQKINYDAVRFNKESGYYYVNDTTSSKGIKFMLDSTGNSIISASVYSGDIRTNSGSNLIDMMNIVASQLGYTNYISASERGTINSVISTYSANEGNVQKALPTFENGMNMKMNMDNLFVELAVGDMPLSYTDEDTSKAQSDADAYVTTPSIEDPTKSAAQNTEPYTFSIGNDFRENYSKDVDDKVGNVTKETTTLKSPTLP